MLQHVLRISKEFLLRVIYSCIIAVIAVLMANEAGKNHAIVMNAAYEELSAVQNTIIETRSIFEVPENVNLELEKFEDGNMQIVIISRKNASIKTTMVINSDFDLISKEEFEKYNESSEIDNFWFEFMMFAVLVLGVSLVVSPINMRRGRFEY